MEIWAEVLPIIIYVLLIILLVVCIIIGMKFVVTMSKVEKIVDDVNDKVQSLNGLFNAVDFVTDKISRVSDVFVDFVQEKLAGLFKNKRKKEMDE